MALSAISQMLEQFALLSYDHMFQLVVCRELSTLMDHMLKTPQTA